MSTGKDGKTRPATRNGPERGRAEAEKRRRLHPEDADHVPKTDAELEAERAAPKDEIGREIPGKLLDVFSQEHEALRQEILSDVRAIVKKLNEYAKSPAGELLRSELAPAGRGDDVRYRDTGLIDLVNKLEQMRPYATICPYCFSKGKVSDKGCHTCQGRGWVVAKTYDRRYGAPSGMIDAVLEWIKEGGAQ